MQNESRLVVPVATRQKASSCLIKLHVRPPDVEEEPIIEGRGGDITGGRMQMGYVHSRTH